MLHCPPAKKSVIDLGVGVSLLLITGIDVDNVNHTIVALDDNGAAVMRPAVNKFLIICCCKRPLDSARVGVDCVQTVCRLERYGLLVDGHQGRRVRALIVEPPLLGAGGEVQGIQNAVVRRTILPCHPNVDGGTVEGGSSP